VKQSKDLIKDGASLWEVCRRSIKINLDKAISIKHQDLHQN
jgi:hypothetical protein